MLALATALSLTALAGSVNGKITKIRAYEKIFTSFDIFIGNAKQFRTGPSLY